MHSLKADVTGYALAPPTQPNLFEQADVAGAVRSIEGDLRDFHALKAALAESRPDVVIHMAAQSVVRRGYADPIETYSSNVMGTVHLLDALRQLGRPCAVVNVTSDKCYENREWVWGYRENDPMGGRDPYSSSKGCAELVAAAYRDSFFAASCIEGPKISLACARAGNAVGGGDWTSNQLIPDLMRAFLAGNSCLIRNPASIRPWQFVLEPLRGYLMLAERLFDNGALFASGWNFGPADSDAYPVSWIADELATSWGNGACWVRDEMVHQHEAHYLKLDVSKTRDALTWRPVLPLKQALQWIVEWYRACQAGDDLASLTRRQIERYESLLSQEATPSGGSVARQPSLVR